MVRRAGARKRRGCRRAGVRRGARRRSVRLTAVMPTLLFKSESDTGGVWRESLQELMPELELRLWPELGNAADIGYALVWSPPGELLRRLSKLKVLFSLGAGVDHLLAGELPPGVPVVRLIDPALTEGMSEYLLLHVLRYHRRTTEYEEQQRTRRWRELTQRRPAQRQIGILGLGVLGTDAAQKLAALGFKVAGWSRTPKSIPGVESYSGKEQLPILLARTEILICLLPLTPETRRILNRETLALLPQGAYLINAARGVHVVERDLLEALDSGRLAGATLDVFETEPLPDDHPFWGHPQVTVTPHIASITNPRTAARHIVDNIRRAERGEPLVGVVDLARGY